MAEKITAKNKNVSQIGLSTHNQDHEINPVALSTTKISAKATTGSIPWDRLAFVSIHMSTSKCRFIKLAQVKYITYTNDIQPSFIGIDSIYRH